MMIPIKKLPHALHLELPDYATDLSAGMDLQAAIEKPCILRPLSRSIIPTGMSIALPPYFEAQIRSRSGLSANHGLIVLNAPGTIDADYRGEIKVILINLGSEEIEIKPGMRIAQMVIARYEKIKWEEVDNLSDTVRGEKGLGSTGI